MWSVRVHRASLSGRLRRGRCTRTSLSRGVSDGLIALETSRQRCSSPGNGGKTRRPRWDHREKISHLRATPVDQPHRDLAHPSIQPSSHPAIQPSTLLPRYHRHTYIGGAAVLRTLRSLCIRIGRCNSCRRSRSKDAAILQAHLVSQNCLERPSLLPTGITAGSKMCFLLFYSPCPASCRPPQELLRPLVPSSPQSPKTCSSITSLPEETKDCTLLSEKMGAQRPTPSRSPASHFSIWHKKAPLPEMIPIFGGVWSC